MDAAAQLHAVSELDDAHLVAVLLAEESQCAELARFVYRHVAVLLQRDVLPYLFVDHPLYRAYLFVGHLLEVREVEAQHVGRHV